MPAITAIGAAVATSVGWLLCTKVSHDLARRRLERDTAEVAALRQAHSGAPPFSEPKFHDAAVAYQAAQPTSTARDAVWPSKVYSAHLQRVARKLDDNTAHALKTEQWSCNGSALSRSAGVCGMARLAVDALRRERALVEGLQAYTHSHRARLAAQDLAARFIVHQAPSDTREVVQLARSRLADTSDMPLSDTHRHLTAVVKDGNAVLAQLAEELGDIPDSFFGGGNDVRRQLERHIAWHQRAADLLHSDGGIFQERADAAHRKEMAEQARRSADAAASAAREARQTRVEAQRAREAEEARRDAETQRLHAASECRDAIRQLKSTIQAMPRTAPQGTAGWRTRGGLPTPAHLSECRNHNDKEPVTLEALNTYAPSDLVVLPSGNCMLFANFQRMLRRVDPYTNLPLPPAESGAADGEDMHSRLARVVDAAERACRV